VANEYSSPGQYVEVRAGEGSGYFVLASEPRRDPWELIMRSGGGASDVLLASPIGTDVEVTSPIGHGFPMAAVRGRRLVVALGGTGLAAARPLVGERVSAGDAHRTAMLVGARTSREVALVEDLRRWADAGVLVTVCLSQGDAGALSLPAAPGHVPDVLRSIAAHSPTMAAGALLFAVGPESMIEALRDAAAGVGISREDVLTNY
jgi:NAD(P)H-flavin reductase